MRHRTTLTWFSLALMAVNAIAQNTFPASGNVGIGTTAPVSSLDVEGVVPVFTLKGSGVNGPAFDIGNTGTNGRTFRFASTGPDDWAGPGNFLIQDASASYATRFAINASGNVGIGTNAPSKQLQTTGAAMFGSDGSNPTGGTDAYGIVYLGDSSHYVRSVFGGGLRLGTYNAPDSLAIQQSTGNVGIGTTAPGYKLDVAGSIHSSTGGVIYPDGSQQITAWTGVVCGGDYAESVDVTGDRTEYAPGDVLVIDLDAPGKFLKSAEPYSTSVLGIYSTKPGTVGRRQTTAQSPDEVPMAMIGIVPTKVSAENGAIKPGDLLVTASIPGYAMKGTDRTRMLGAVIGKALGKLDSGTGVIEVGVTLQ